MHAYAAYAASNSRPKSRPLSCALRPATQGPVEIPASTMKRECAASAVPSLCATSTGSRSSVHDHVLRVTPTGKSEQVYNLSVDSVPEYYAGGILVHNCADATLYTWRAACAYHERLPERAPSVDERLKAEEAAQIEQAERGLTNEHRWWEQ